MENPLQNPNSPKITTTFQDGKIHVLVIEALMETNKIDPENHHNSKILEDEFNRSWNIEEERREEPPKDDLKISPGASNKRSPGQPCLPSSRVSLLGAAQGGPGQPCQCHPHQQGRCGLSCVLHYRKVRDKVQYGTV